MKIYSDPQTATPMVKNDHATLVNIPGTVTIAFLDSSNVQSIFSSLH